MNPHVLSGQLQFIFFMCVKAEICCGALYSRYPAGSEVLAAEMPRLPNQMMMTYTYLNMVTIILVFTCNPAAFESYTFYVVAFILNTQTVT